MQKDWSRDGERAIEFIEMHEDRIDANWLGRTSLEDQRLRAQREQKFKDRTGECKVQKDRNSRMQKDGKHQEQKGGNRQMQKDGEYQMAGKIKTEDAHQSRDIDRNIRYRKFWQEESGRKKSQQSGKFKFKSDS